MAACPTEDVLAALVQQTLGDAEAEAVRAHLDGCEDCAQVVIAAARAAKPSSAKPPDEPPSRPSAPGTQLGRYRVRGLLGSGGMGHVYEAHDVELDRAVALKVLRPDLALGKDKFTARLVRESRLMAKITHPSVVTVYDVGRLDDRMFIAMELIRGETLGAYLARHKRTWREIVEMFEKAGAGLAAAHRAGVIHRDFKPENVLVAGDGERVVVTDFGIARAGAAEDRDTGEVIPRPSDPHLTATGAAIGTPAYMAPEQLEGGVVDRRADIFAFAVALWKELFGARPFEGKRVDEIRAAMETSPRAPSGVVPPALVRVLLRGLSRAPADRWPDMESFVGKLAQIRTRRRRWTLGASALGGVALAASVAAFTAHSHAVDPCAQRVSYEPISLRTVLDPASIPAVTARLDTLVKHWNDTETATCRADRSPPQSPATASCLDARRLELDAFVEAAIDLHGRNAPKLLASVGDAAICVTPPPSALHSMFPVERELRRKVMRLRMRTYEIDALIDRSDMDGALAAAEQYVKDAGTEWPPLRADALFQLGTVQSLGGKEKEASATLREAATLAETSHDDTVAAACWMSLAESDTAEPERTIEYLGYAKAALERSGWPTEQSAYYHSYMAGALIELGRLEEAEKEQRLALDLSQRGAPEHLADAIGGLGYLYEGKGNYKEAIDAYRRALAALQPDNHSRNTEINFRERLATNLALRGTFSDAETEARTAAALAEKYLPPENMDRAIAASTLGEVLLHEGKLDEALAHARTAEADVKGFAGERSQPYGVAMMLEANVLAVQNHRGDALKLYARACDILAFETGEDSTEVAECLLDQGITLEEAGRHAEALAIANKLLPTLEQDNGAQDPDVGLAHLLAGTARLGLGQPALEDLEKAVAIFGKLELEPGYLAAARSALARALWAQDPTRAESELVTALAGFEHASARWSFERQAAVAWRSAHPARPPR